MNTPTWISSSSWSQAISELFLTIRQLAAARIPRLPLPTRSDSFKFLYADSIYGEMAVFTPDELLTAAYAPGRLVWRRASVPDEWAAPRDWPPRRSPLAVDHLLGEALTNLYVGLCRFYRGEKRYRLCASSRGYAVDRVIDLAGLMAAGVAGIEDLFDGPRRFEQRFHPGRRFSRRYCPATTTARRRRRPSGPAGSPLPRGTGHRRRNP